MTMWLECHLVRDTGALQELNLVLHINCPIYTLAGVARLFVPYPDFPSPPCPTSVLNSVDAAGMCLQ